MSDWFGEKSPQVNPHALVAFGIEVSSRHSQASELISMMKFAEKCALNNVEHYVKKVFCDSKACMYSIDLDGAVRDGDPVATTIKSIASENFGQYFWFDEPVIAEDE